MNDRYLHKAKRVDSGEWIEGHYFKGYVHKRELPENMICETDHDKKTSWAREIDLSTLCQCTGIKDKKGIKIWENDIVKARGRYIGKVIYQNGEYKIEWSNEDHIRHDIYFWVTERKLEVIGNIFDNPEIQRQ